MSYERLDIQIAELWQRLGGLPHPEEARDIWRGIWFEEAHHSTAIEGNTLVLKQVEALLDEGRAVGNKELAEYMEATGTDGPVGSSSTWSWCASATPQRSSTSARGPGTSQRSDEPTTATTEALGEMLARAILDNLYRFVLPAAAGPARLVPLSALAVDGIKASALRAAANRGRLEAIRGADGEWRSSRNWVDEYLASRYRRE